MSNAGGMKYDGGKARWSLLYTHLAPVLWGVVRVLEFGAKKYKAHSWMDVPEGRTRYADAVERHREKMRQGEYLDPESGCPHWAHKLCNELFLAYYACEDAPKANDVSGKPTTREETMRDPAVESALLASSPG